MPIIEALSQRRLQDTIGLSNELIARDITLFRNKSEASWIKSEAYRYRADATYRTTGNLQQALELLKAAADLGNLKADKKITEILWRKSEGDPDYASVDVRAAELAKYLRIGAELGDPISAAMLGASNSAADLGAREKVYWSLIGFALAINDDVAYRRRMMASVINRVGRDEAVAAVKAYGLLPPITPAGPGTLPGRGLISTLYADANLRRDYGFSYGRRGTEGERAGSTPSVLDIFRATQGVANVAGDVRAFLLLPVTKRFDDPALLSVPKENLISLISPSDNVFVRCGPLTHVGMVHHIDPAQYRIFLSDGLWQFWQPSHNACITQFDLVPFEHGGYLAAVPLSEFATVLEAVSTLRDPPNS